MGSHLDFFATVFSKESVSYNQNFGTVSPCSFEICIHQGVCDQQHHEVEITAMTKTKSCLVVWSQLI